MLALQLKSANSTEPAMPRLEDTHLYKGHKAAEKAKEEDRRENYEMAYYYYALALQQYGKSTMCK